MWECRKFRGDVEEKVVGAREEWRGGRIIKKE